MARDRNEELLEIGDTIFILCGDNRKYWLRLGEVTLIQASTHPERGNDDSVLIQHKDKRGNLLGGIWWEPRHTMLYTRSNVLNWTEKYLELYIDNAHHYRKEFGDVPKHILDVWES